MKQLILIFLFIVFNILSFNKSKASDYEELNCDWREHPSKESPINIDQNSVYNINQVLSLSLNSSEALVPVAWSKEELDESGYTGTNKGFVKVNIEKEGDYIIWITAKAFITPFQFANEKPIPAKNYTPQSCLEESQYLRAVYFPLKKGVNNIQLSHSKDEVSLFTVTPAEEL
ncbi:MAG: hypothetical protein GDA46_05245 [Bdellovibrionales bacterium]|nr:hypothetical protein [Bdellovibrionales bacterium]